MRLLRANLEGIAGELRKDFDWLLLIIGYEGIGKSTLGMVACKIVDHSFNVSRICFEADEFHRLVDTVPKYSAILVDEGTALLFSRDSMKRDNKRVVATLTQCRYKNLFIAICVPDFFLIDKYVRVHRARTLLKLVGRGRFGFYSRKRMRQIRIDPFTRMIRYPAPNFYDDYPKVKGKEWDEYKKKREAYQLEYSSVELMEATERTKELFRNTVSVSEFAKAKGVNKETIRIRIKEDKIKATKDGSGRWRIPKTYL